MVNFELERHLDPSSWTVDSGASIHMSYDIKDFTHFRKINGIVRTADGSATRAEGEERIKIFISCDEEPVKIILDNVAYVPELSVKLLSVNELTKHGFEVMFEESSCKIRINDDFVPFARFTHASYVVNELAHKQVFPCIHEWHRRLAHSNLSDIRNMQKFGLKIMRCGCTDNCASCVQCESIEILLEPSGKPLRALDIITGDLCGPVEVNARGGIRYVLTLIDLASDFKIVKFLKKKSHAKNKIMIFVEQTKNQLNKKPKVLRSVRGVEFIDDELKDFLSNKGIEVQTETKEIWEENCIEDSCSDATKTLIVASRLPNSFWPEAMKNFVYTQNRMIRSGKTASPIELFTGNPLRSDFL